MTALCRVSGATRANHGPLFEAAVNAALLLERPLLVKGEPGTGKTLLGVAIAEAMGLSYPLVGQVDDPRAGRL